MKYIWTDAGDDPSWEVGDRHGIDGYFWPMFDPLTTQENLLDTQSRGYEAGVYFARNWSQFTDKTPTQVATIVADEYKRLAVPKLRLQDNDEHKTPIFIISTLEQLRHLLPKVNLSWTMEGMQGGWMNSDFVARILKCHVRLVPQGYWGSEGKIEGYWAEDQVLRNLTRRGFPENIISLFYDAAALPRGWNGFAFTMGRLP